METITTHHPTPTENNNYNQGPGKLIPRWKPSVKTKHVPKCSLVDNLLPSKWIMVTASVMSVILALTHFQPVEGYSILPKAQRRLGDAYQESVYYDPDSLLELHTRRKREIRDAGEEFEFGEPLRFTLHAKSRDFHLVLKPDEEVLHPGIEIESATGHKSTYSPKGNVFHGYLEDEPGSSRVEGLVTSDGYFDGVITTGDGDQFHIEPAERYIDSATPPTKHYSYSPAGVLYDSATIPLPPEDESQHLFQHISHPTNLNFSSPPRSKRAVTLDPRRKTCMLYLQADHLFHGHLGSEEAAINMMTRHIQRVNEIYRVTDFDGDGTPDGISFMIKRIKVHNSSSGVNYPYLGDFQVIKFLEKFSEGDYESFCLAYMFTFRDFEGGTLGLAWTGDLKNAGGVCERKGHFRGGLKSLNTGIITLLNYGKVVLPAVSYVTLAHEIGHNFGSPHDPESERECVPGGRDGNYIMFARATAGDQRNNQRFSPCSLRSIRPVLAAKARNIHGCFTEPKKGICGNREVEPGEECDCGWEEDCTESCCWPNRLDPPPNETPCTLKPFTACSPSQGPCCTSACTLTAGNACRSDNGCRHTASCSGRSAVCPSSVHKPNKTVCGDGAAVCFMGECTGSICLAYGLNSCQCSPQPWDSAGKVCELCCKQPGDGAPCLSSFELNDAPYDVPDLYAKPGSPCKNYTGYCDAYRTCREVDPSGPLATLRNLLLADEGLSAIAAWIDTHWYAVVSFVALLIVMMVLTAKLCGKQAKKKLRKITILHSNVDAIQIERSYWDEGGEEHVVHPAAVRKKIPLRKKIREKKNKGGKRRGSNLNGGAILQNGAGPSTSSGPPAGGGKESHRGGVRYGTLWRKRRAAERSRLTTGSSKHKTDNNDHSPPSQPVQSFDLVKLNTPPPVAAHHNSAAGSSAPVIYPSLVVAEAATPSTSSAGPLPPATTKNEHQYEAKTAILPSAGDARRKKRSSRRPAPSGSPREKEGKISGRTSKPSSSSRNPAKMPGAIGKSKKSPSGARPGKKSVTTPVADKPKTTMQIVYTPPFSVKVVHVPVPTDAAPTPTPTTSQPSKITPPKKKTPAILDTPLPPVPEGALLPTPLVVVEDTSGGGPPPPYTTLPPLPPQEAAPPRPQSSSSSSKRVKSSGSFLSKPRGARGRIRKEKGELRVLIPPPNLNDDETETPTPGT